MKVRDIMTTEVVTLKVNDELSLASDIMTLGRIRHLPVVEDDRLVGIISQRDLYRASLASVVGHDYAEQRVHLETVTIRNIMAKEVFTVEPDTEIYAAGRIMLEKRIGCLPIVQGDVLKGMVTETDILQFYVSRHQNEITGH
ncbi:MAG: CBS domain-containing protein [Deltaproteobacteria bacterium]|jgi:CBS domain-containing protein|nr:CBS domain-containing protein [Deltaproteobacteria bacterium]MBW2192314.1 CBS domain-containing protein [Deltaproteobacteria bacterium]